MKIEFEWSTKVRPTQVCHRFIQGMLNRMIVGYYRHGDSSRASTKDIPAMLEKRWKKYMRTGNTEVLLDVANLAMIEFMNPSHPEAHYQAEDSGRSLM